MTPLASVAMLEKLALLKIARCRAPALSSTSSASAMVLGPMTFMGRCYGLAREWSGGSRTRNVPGSSAIWAQPRHVQVARGGKEARARGAVLQAALASLLAR